VPQPVRAGDHPPLGAAAAGRRHPEQAGPQRPAGPSQPPQQPRRLPGQHAACPGRRGHMQDLRPAGAPNTRMTAARRRCRCSLGRSWTAASTTTWTLTPSCSRPRATGAASRTSPRRAPSSPAPPHPPVAVLPACQLFRLQRYEGDRKSVGNELGKACAAADGCSSSLDGDVAGCRLCSMPAAQLSPQTGTRGMAASSAGCRRRR